MALNEPCLSLSVWPEQKSSVCFHRKMGMQQKVKIPIYRILEGQSPKNEFIEICYFS